MDCQLIKHGLAILQAFSVVYRTNGSVNPRFACAIMRYIAKPERSAVRRACARDKRAVARSTGAEINEKGSGTNLQPSDIYLSDSIDRLLVLSTPLRRLLFSPAIQIPPGLVLLRRIRSRMITRPPTYFRPRPRGFYCLDKKAIPVFY